MKYILIWGLIAAGAVFFIGAYRVYGYDPATADFLVKCALSIGTLSAVLFALFGDYLRETLDPIRVKIELPTESNTVIDKCLINGVPANAYFHHLLVRNLTPHKPIKNCRVWLKKIFVQQVNNEWSDEAKFAVPRLMEWAPSEYSRDKRTFSKQQVFDLGRSLQYNGGFIAAYDRDQGGAVNRQFPVGSKLKFVFYVTADNYQKEEEFCFEIEVLQSVLGTPVTPARVTPV
jgi:hypothetical protein